LERSSRVVGERVMEVASEAYSFFEEVASSLRFPTDDVADAVSHSDLLSLLKDIVDQQARAPARPGETVMPTEHSVISSPEGLVSQSPPLEAPGAVEGITAAASAAASSRPYTPVYPSERAFLASPQHIVEMSRMRQCMAGSSVPIPMGVFSLPGAFVLVRDVMRARQCSELVALDELIRCSFDASELPARFPPNPPTGFGLLQLQLRIRIVTTILVLSDVARLTQFALPRPEAIGDKPDAWFGESMRALEGSVRMLADVTEQAQQLVSFESCAPVYVGLLSSDACPRLPFEAGHAIYPRVALYEVDLSVADYQRLLPAVSNPYLRGGGVCVDLLSMRPRDDPLLRHVDADDWSFVVPAGTLSAGEQPVFQTWPLCSGAPVPDAPDEPAQVRHVQELIERPALPTEAAAPAAPATLPLLEASSNPSNLARLTSMVDEFSLTLAREKVFSRIVEEVSSSSATFADAQPRTAAFVVRFAVDIVHSTSSMIDASCARNITDALRLENGAVTTYSVAEESACLRLQALLDVAFRHQKASHSSQDLRVGDFVNALDTQNKWCLAQVRAERVINDNREIFIHYLGWPTKWNEWLSVDTESQRAERVKAQRAIARAYSLRSASSSTSSQNTPKPCPSCARSPTCTRC
jgi:hypothetical protein